MIWTLLTALSCLLPLFPLTTGFQLPCHSSSQRSAKEALYFTLFLFENLLQLFHMVDSLCSFRSQIKFHLLKIVFPCHDYLMSPPNLPCTCLWITFTLFKRTFFFLFPFWLSLLIYMYLLIAGTLISFVDDSDLTM